MSKEIHFETENLIKRYEGINDRDIDATGCTSIASKRF